MNNLTENQSTAMHALIAACLDNMGGKTLSDLQADPCTWVTACDLVDAGWSQKQAEGTFGSLVASGLIIEDQINRGQVLYALTDDFEVLSEFYQNNENSAPLFGVKNAITDGRWSLVTTSRTLAGVPVQVPVSVGDELADFRGDRCKVTGQGRPPHKASSTGRIELNGREYFPSVAGCEWLEDWSA